MSSRTRRLVALGSIVALFVLGLGVYKLATKVELPQNEKVAHITVFVHGSVYTGLYLLNTSQVLVDDLSQDSWYVSLVNQVRKNPVLWGDQMLLEQGWQPIGSEQIEQVHSSTLPAQEKKRGAYFIAACYNVFDKKRFSDGTELSYFTFGHLGLLSCQYRREAAKGLYAHLCQIVNQYKNSHQEVSLTVVCHSHGGNIVLHLAEHEAQSQCGLTINELVMFGTPIQTETASFAYNPMFRRVVNCYSDGDYVQSADTLSTSTRRSYKAFSDQRLSVDKPRNSVYDVRMIVNDDPWHIDHMNMWFLGRSRKSCHTLHPLPLMVLAPAILKMLDAHPSCQRVDCHVLDGNEELKLSLSPSGKSGVLCATDNLHKQALTMGRCTAKEWENEDLSAGAIVSKRTLQALYQAYQSVRGT